MDHNRKKLTGIIPPLVTPLDASGKIDEKALKRLIEYCIQGGVSGIFMLGSCGEGTSLTGAQKRTAVKCALEAAEGKGGPRRHADGEDGRTPAQLAAASRFIFSLLYSIGTSTARLFLLLFFPDSWYNNPNWQRPGL